MRAIGDPASACPQCGSTRVWKHATKDGSKWRQYCSACHAARSYQSRVKRRKAYNEQLAVKRRTIPEVRAYELWKSAKDRASRRGIIFKLTRERVVLAVVRGFCEVTGLRFDLDGARGEQRALSPSVDRRHPKEGYTDDNCQITCWLYNRAKGNGSHEDVLLLAEALNAKQNRKAA